MATAVQTERTNWLGVLLSALMPLALAASFVALALEPEWEPSETWLYGLLALAPLDFVRALILSFLGDAYKKNNSPQAAIMDFLLSIAILAALGLIVAVFNLGPVATYNVLIDPMFYQIAGLPIFVLLLDSVFGIMTFRGDRLRQAQRLLAVSEDMAEWMMFSAFRMSFVLLALIGVLALGKQEGWPSVQALPEVDGQFMRKVGLFYLAWYFFVKAVFAAYVHTARFAVTGTGLLQARWLQWVFFAGTKQASEEKPRARVQVYRPQVESVLAFEEKVIQDAQARREGMVK